MSERKKTTAEAMAELNKAFRDMLDVIAVVYIKASKDINAAWKKGKA